MVAANSKHLARQFDNVHEQNTKEEKNSKNKLQKWLIIHLFVFGMIPKIALKSFIKLRGRVR